MVTLHVARRRSLRRRVADEREREREREREIHHRAAEITELILGLVRNFAAAGRCAATFSRRRVAPPRAGLISQRERPYPDAFLAAVCRALLNPKNLTRLRVFLGRSAPA